MKKTGTWFTALAFAVALVAPVALLAQDEKDKDKKEVKEKKDLEQIVITRKSNDEKVVVEINGDKITVNGKPIEEYKDKNGDIKVHLSKLKDLEFLTQIPGMAGKWTFNGNNDFNVFNEDDNRAMLGVTTEINDAGAEINSVNKDGAAEKIGLKEGDIITKIDDKRIESPDDLSAAVQSHKPGDKVTITYLRDKKEQKATAELTKWKGMYAFSGTDFRKEIPRVMATPRISGTYGQAWSWSGGNPKLGISVQDTDDGKGVKIIEVDEESNAAKAGIKEDDVVTEVDGKAVNSTDEITKIIKDSKDKASVTFKLQRAGKSQSVEVKMPRKIKTADL